MTVLQPLLRQLLLATTLAVLTVSGAAAAAKGGMKVGDKPLTYRETVKHDNLWTISRKVMPTAEKVTLSQMMAAMLRRNPEAFSKNNVFYLREGVVLTIPSLKEVRAEDAAKAKAQFLHHKEAWKGARSGHSAMEPMAESADTAPVSKTVKAKKEKQSARSERAEKPREMAPPLLTSAPAAPKEAPVAKPVAQTAVAAATSAPSAAPVSIPVEKAPQAAPAAPAAASAVTVPEAPIPPKAEGVGVLPYVLGLLAIVAALFFGLRRRKAMPSAAPAGEGAVANTPHSNVVLSMAGMETSRAIEDMEVTQQVVAYGSAEEAAAAPAQASEEASLKIKMAMAYLELQRDGAARALLEEVVIEGSPALRAEAEKIMGRWTKALVTQESVSAGGANPAAAT